MHTIIWVKNPNIHVLNFGHVIDIIVLGLAILVKCIYHALVSLSNVTFNTSYQYLRPFIILDSFFGLRLPCYSDLVMWHMHSLIFFHILIWVTWLCHGSLLPLVICLDRCCNVPSWFQYFSQWSWVEWLPIVLVFCS